MGKIYKISKQTVGHGYHDYILYQKDDGTVRVLRGEPDMEPTFDSPIFGRITVSEQAYDDSSLEIPGAVY
jgi:hypothetical protein